MTNEERDLIARYIARVGGAPQQGGFLPGASGSVPQSQAALPPIDRDADQFIKQQLQQYPEAPYRITQTALVQEAALAEMTNQVRRLQWELEQTRNAMQQQSPAQAQPQQQQSRGFFGSLFGGGQQQQARPGVWGGQPGYQPSSPPPQPQYPPNYQPGMFQRSGSGFLGSALTTAAGVAGGLVVGNALMNAFGGHENGGGFLGGGAAGAGGPWGGADQTGGAFDGAGTVPVSDPTGGFPTDQGGGGADPFGGGGSDGGFQNTGFDQGGSDPFGGGGGFDQGGGGDPFGGGGGFDQGGGGGFDNT